MRREDTQFRLSQIAAAQRLGGRINKCTPHENKHYQAVNGMSWSPGSLFVTGTLKLYPMTGFAFLGLHGLSTPIRQ